MVRYTPGYNYEWGSHARARPLGLPPSLAVWCGVDAWRGEASAVVDRRGPPRVIEHALLLCGFRFNRVGDAVLTHNQRVRA